jgi:mannosyl-oligosaccharide alpha-1,2-mannosidase
LIFLNEKFSIDDDLQAAEESMLRKTPTTNLMYFGEQRSGRLDPQMGHLTCFVGGLYILSIQTGALVNSSSDKHELEIAQGIGKTCRESYIRARKKFILLLNKKKIIFVVATGLGPEGFHFERVDVEAKSLRDNEKYYILRPEAIETWFYLWRHTHDQIYRDWAWDAVIVCLMNLIF